MNQKRKADLLAHFEKELLILDRLIADNASNQNNVKSLMEEYRKLAELLARLRDTPTVD